MVREHGGDGEIVVPPTIHALLQARIDSLDGDVRVVMERGSVEGEVFHRGAVAELSPDHGSRGCRGTPGDARAEGADPLHAADLPRGRGLPLPPPPHPRRRVRVAAEGDACGASRALRRLARACTSSWSVTRSSGTTSSRHIGTELELDPADPALPALAERAAGASRRRRARRDRSRRLGRGPQRCCAALRPSFPEGSTGARRSRRTSPSPSGRQERSRRGDVGRRGGRAASDPVSLRSARLFADACSTVSTSGVVSAEQAHATEEEALSNLDEAGDDVGLALYWRSVADTSTGVRLSATETGAVVGARRSTHCAARASEAGSRSSSQDWC